MLIGYAVLVLVSISVVFFALINLYRINQLNNFIVNGYIPIHEKTEEMLEVLLAQDNYEKRSLILRRKDLRSLFWERSSEFKNLLLSLKELPHADQFLFSQIEKLHTQYNDIFMKELHLLKTGSHAAAAVISNTELKNALEKLSEILRTTSSKAQVLRDASMAEINDLGGKAFQITIILCMSGVIIGALFAGIITYHISSSVHKLQKATIEFSAGNFQYNPGIHTKDEIGSLADAFLAMGKRLKNLEDMYLDASPLTRLPGGVAVESVMNQRLKGGNPIAFCVLDLDNFKVYNDYYGYALGNEVIKETARILETATKTKGSSDDFLGHIDGDDFVVITKPDCMREVCSEIVRLFDQQIPQFYDKKARENGSIQGKNRQGETMQFPLMTISIAIVTNEHRTFVNTLEASTVAAELKEYAKRIPKSIFVVDKRHSSGDFQPHYPERKS
ncbi:MAG: diguanylate cyclase [Nitrospirota bacterium]